MLSCHQAVLISSCFYCVIICVYLNVIFYMHDFFSPALYIEVSLKLLLVISVSN